MPGAAVRPASALEMAVMEANAGALGVSVDALMENAGRAIAEEVARRLPPAPQRIAVLAGAGNNGGDGTCAAHYLHQWGFRPEIWLARPASEIRSPAARRCLDRAAGEMPVHQETPTIEQLQGSALLVDALLGSGQAGTPRSPYSEVVERANASGIGILAVDVPTGLGSPHAVRPTWTVALTVPKVGMEPGNSGEVVVRDIGIPATAREETGPGEFLLLPARPVPDPRGRSARILILGGGPYSGAVALTALAALRSGAERATIVAPEPAAASLRSQSPDLVVESVGEDRFASADAPRLTAAVGRARVDAVVLGMGVGDADDSRDALQRVMSAIPRDRPAVIDADGLRALSAQPGAPRPWVATPNAGEYERVFRGSADEREDDVAAHAREWGLTLLVKGEFDIISDGTRSYRNRHHHPAATVGGVGDVLAGVVGSLLAQGLAPVDAARLGAYWVGDAGTRAAEAGGFGIVASDVLGRLPEALVAGLRRVRAAV